MILHLEFVIAMESKTPQVLQILKLLLTKLLFTFQFYFNGYNSRYDAPVMTIYDCSQPHVTLAAKDRNIIAATFTSFMQRNIGIINLW